MNKPTIPIFYACDDAFVKFTIVSLQSMIENASKDYHYEVCVLHTGITKPMMEKVFKLSNENFSVTFEDVSGYIASIQDKLPIRDYYSKTTYFRFFIAEMFPGYDKALYIDSDTIIKGDVSELYNIDLGDNILGACNEQAMVQVDEYGTYCEKVVGVDRNEFFNAGILSINCREFRNFKVLDKFIKYLHIYNFAVTQDEDYLNLICKGRVMLLDQRWNTEIFGEIAYPIEEAKILHYIMTSKPWHYRDCRHGEYFWEYAKKTEVYDEIKKILDEYTDEQRRNDEVSGEKLLALAVKETNREDNFLNIMKMREASDREQVLQKIEEYERAGAFDVDVENDPPSKPLYADDIEYIKKGPLKRLKTRFAYARARRYLNGLIKDGKMIIKDVRGIENFKNLYTGAIITCNHFNAYDSFAIQIAYDKSEHKQRKFYRVIREGNYTAFGGFYGFLMRNCYTLPLSSQRTTMRKFMIAVNTLLKDGHFVLFYPEQSMWWNYRKPKPLKDGAYRFAAKNKVPVLPCFITMKDTDKLDENGYYVQEYTIHIEKPIYPDADRNDAENIVYMREENARIWREIYEREYGIPLKYTTEQSEAKEQPCGEPA